MLLIRNDSFYTVCHWQVVGDNPVIKAQDDVDLLTLDRKGERGIFVECKFRNRPMAMEEYDDLVTATEAFPGVKEKKLMFVSKGGFTETVRMRAEDEGWSWLR